MTRRPSMGRALLVMIAAAAGATALIAFVLLLAPSHPVPAGVIAVVVIASVYPLAETAIDNTRRYGPHQGHSRGHGHQIHGTRDEIDSFRR
jgi:hypothetical protein